MYSSPPHTHTQDVAYDVPSKSVICLVPACSTAGRYPSKQRQGGGSTSQQLQNTSRDLLCTAVLQAPILRYNDEEWEHLIDPEPGWSREESDYLLDLCALLDLRWLAIADRYEVIWGCLGCLGWGSREI
jgi:hypothetical protein